MVPDLISFTDVGYAKCQSSGRSTSGRDLPGVDVHIYYLVHVHNNVPASSAPVTWYARLPMYATYVASTAV